MNVAQTLIGLTNLAPVGIEDAESFLAVAERARVKAWLYYFPLLYLHGQFRAHMLRWEHYAGSILVYQIRRKQGRSRLDLYLPPFPFDPAALRHALQRMRDFNGDRSSRIIWVQESDALPVARAGFEIFFKEEEFIFDHAAVMGLEGGRLQAAGAVGGSLAGAGCHATLTGADRPPCLAVLEAWRERLIANGITPNGYSSIRPSAWPWPNAFPHRCSTRWWLRWMGRCAALPFRARSPAPWGSTASALLTSAFEGSPISCVIGSWPSSRI
jgi:hypothetical protein